MSKSTLSILTSILLGGALAIPVAVASPPSGERHHFSHLRGPLAARLASRFAEPEGIRPHKQGAKPVWLKPALLDPSYTIIDEPDADPSLYGTRVFFINESYQVSGQFMDSSGQFHAFLCTFPACKAKEDFTVITVKDSDTFGFVVNDKGWMCGGYVIDPDTGIENAWIRNPKTGKIDTIGIGNGETVCQWVNNKGVVTGFYADDNGADHGYIRAKDGTITTFDDPIGGSGPDQGTFVININDKGVVSGSVIDINNVEHGFLRYPDGTFENYDVPGAGQGAGQGTDAIEIEGNGWVTGAYIDSNDVRHGFLRRPDGEIIAPIDPHDIGTNPGQGVVDVEHFEAGWAVGEYTDANDVYHGFICKRCETDGRKIVEFDPPGAGDIGTYTVVSSTGDHVIVGTYKDDNAIRHGFVRTP